MFFFKLVFVLGKLVFPELFVSMEGLQLNLDELMILFCNSFYLKYCVFFPVLLSTYLDMGMLCPSFPTLKYEIGLQQYLACECDLEMEN
jgi:hypothetical protein